MASGALGALGAADGLEDDPLIGGSPQEVGRHEPGVKGLICGRVGAGNEWDEGTRKFKAEFDEPAPAPDELAVRLAELIAGDHVAVLLARERAGSAAVGVAVTEGEGGPLMPAYEREL